MRANNLEWLTIQTVRGRLSVFAWMIVRHPFDDHFWQFWIDLGSDYAEIEVPDVLERLLSMLVISADASSPESLVIR